MKKINKYIWIAVLPLLLVASCKKETTKHVSKTVKVSFPTIALNGSPIVIVAVGANYTDAGAKLTDDITGQIKDIQPTSSNVNTATPGLYIVTFSASNANGFETSESRVVAVTNVSGTTDVSGVYTRPATGLTCTITKLSNGVYKVQNPGGAGVGVNTVVYFVETSPGVFVCPPQPTDAGIMSVLNIHFTATGATWNVSNPTYGTGLRTFVK